MKIIIYGNRHQDKHLDALTRLFETLRRAGVWIGVEERFFNYLYNLMPDLDIDAVISGRNFTADLAFSIGGDGTFLRTAAWIGIRQIPILGINTGHLGYLADAEISDCEHIVSDILEHRYNVEDRSLIQVETNAGVVLPNRFALNEVAILKNASASMLRMETSVNGNELTTYLGDGLIISTPTGSTAYNLSVGGPVLHPACADWIISPIAAHSLTMRPLVLPDSTILTVTTLSNRSQMFRISVDGASVSLPVGSWIRLSKAGHVTRVLHLPEHSFASTLRNKLMWGADAR